MLSPLLQRLMFRFDVLGKLINYIKNGQFQLGREPIISELRQGAQKDTCPYQTDDKNAILSMDKIHASPRIAKICILLTDIEMHWENGKKDQKRERLEGCKTFANSFSCLHLIMFKMSFQQEKNIGDC